MTLLACKCAMHPPSGSHHILRVSYVLARTPTHLREAFPSTMVEQKITARMETLISCILLFKGLTGIQPEAEMTMPKNMQAVMWHNVKNTCEADMQATSDCLFYGLARQFIQDAILLDWVPGPAVPMGCVVPMCRCLSQYDVQVHAHDVHQSGCSCPLNITSLTGCLKPVLDSRNLLPSRTKMLVAYHMMMTSRVVAALREVCSDMILA